MKRKSIIILGICSLVIILSLFLINFDTGSKEVINNKLDNVHDMVLAKENTIKKSLNDGQLSPLITVVEKTKKL